MTEISMDTFVEWLADDSDDSYDMIDFVNEFAELVGIVIDDDEPEVKKAEPVPAQAAMAGAAVIAGSAPSGDGMAHVWDKPGPVDEFDGPDPADSKFVQGVEDWAATGLGERDEKHPLKIFDELAEHIEG